MIQSLHCRATHTLTIMSSRIPLSSRPLDLLYFSFFIVRFANTVVHRIERQLQMHIPASLLVDLQALLHPNTFLPSLPEWYTGYSADPLIRGAMLKDPQLVWFNCFLYVEMYDLSAFHSHYRVLTPASRLFQLPVFIIGARGLWKGKLTRRKPVSSTHA